MAPSKVCAGVERRLTCFDTTMTRQGHRPRLPVIELWIFRLPKGRELECDKAAKLCAGTFGAK